MSSRPSNQRLSKNVAKPRIVGSQGAAIKYSPTAKTTSNGSKFARREPKVSQGRMSKTGISVLSSVPIHQRTANKSLTKRVDGFDSLRLSPSVSDAIQTGALKTLEYASPTTIQSLTVPAMLRDAKGTAPRAFLVAAETGSGKTLAYLAPVLHHLKNEEESLQVTRQIARPRSVIILPSTELVKQVGAVVKSMSYSVKLSSSILLPEFNFRRAKNQVLMSPVDVLVTMPFQLQKLLEEGILSLEQTTHLVIDEADTLLDVSFADTVPPIIKMAKGLKTITFCSATIPRSMDAYLRKNYAEIERLVSPKIHSIPRRISTKFIDVEKEYKGNKNMALHQILRDLSLDQSEPGKVKKVILFVNRRETIAEVTEFLKSKGIEALPFSRDTTDRDNNISHFLDGQKEEEASSPMKVLVTTDLASRGIDTTPVKNVIIYDTPHSTIDLLHRIGRTGRAGRRGTAYILLSKKRGEAWIREVKKLSISGQPLI